MGYWYDAQGLVFFNRPKKGQMVRYRGDNVTDAKYWEGALHALDAAFIAEGLILIPEQVKQYLLQIRKMAWDVSGVSDTFPDGKGINYDRDWYVESIRLGLLEENIPMTEQSSMPLRDMFSRLNCLGLEKMVGTALASLKQPSRKWN